MSFETSDSYVSCDSDIQENTAILHNGNILPILDHTPNHFQSHEVKQHLRENEHLILDISKPLTKFCRMS